MSEVEVERFDLSKFSFTIERDEKNHRYWLVIKRKVAET